MFIKTLNTNFYFNWLFQMYVQYMISIPVVDVVVDGINAEVVVGKAEGADVIGYNENMQVVNTLTNNDLICYSYIHHNHTN